MHKPFVSICIAAYQARRYLPATLESVREQTYTDWELIVTEDGSADPIRDLVEAFAKSVSQTVTYQAHTTNQGLPTARNTGIAEARGTWIALLDSDDLWTENHLMDLLACAEKDSRHELIHSASVLFESDTGRELEIRAPSEAAVQTFPLSLYLGDYSVQPSSVLLRKSLWAQVNGFNPAYRYVEDREMWLRCARAGARFVFNEQVSCRYRKHGSALTTHASPMAVASALVLDQHLDWELVPLALRRSLTAEAWTSAGRLNLQGSPASARAHFARAWRLRRSARLACYRLVALLRY